MGRNTADFGQDANAAFDKVQSWRDELNSSKLPSIRYKNNRRQNFMDRKPATNYGAKNGNSKEARAKRAEDAKK
jgi:hypothetical protein